MAQVKTILSATACVAVIACGDGADIAENTFQTRQVAFESQEQIVSLLTGEGVGPTADFATLVTQGAATYEGPVAINLGTSPLIGENILGEPTLNQPDLLGEANMRTAFTDTGATLEGDFANFVGRDGAEYGGGLTLTNGTISGSSSVFGSGGTEATARVSGTLTGTGEGAGTYSASVDGRISEDAQNILLNGQNIDGEAGRDFVFTAAGTIPAAQ